MINSSMVSQIVCALPQNQFIEMNQPQTILFRSAFSGSCHVKLFFLCCSLMSLSLNIIELSEVEGSVGGFTHNPKAD